MFRWLPGRQNGTYEKLPLVSARFPLPFDSYLILSTRRDRTSPHTWIRLLMGATTG
jgi:hypothetical protein